MLAMNDIRVWDHYEKKMVTVDIIYPGYGWSFSPTKHTGDTGPTYQPCSERFSRLLFATGVRDKNGKMIYDGDILDTQNDGKNGADVWEFGDHKLKVVLWDNTLARFTGLPETTRNSVFGRQYMEVVGNVFANQKMLIKERKYFDS